MSALHGGAPGRHLSRRAKFCGLGLGGPESPLLDASGKSIRENRFQRVNEMSGADNLHEDLAAPEVPGAAPGKVLSPEARRALEEAEERRKSASALDLAREIDGPSGEEPTRYGDWERKGLAVDF